VVPSFPNTVIWPASPEGWRSRQASAQASLNPDSIEPDSIEKVEKGAVARVGLKGEDAVQVGLGQDALGEAVADCGEPDEAVSEGEQGFEGGEDSVLGGGGEGVEGGCEGLEVGEVRVARGFRVSARRRRTSAW
jgi:hypothetical protein